MKKLLTWPGTRFLPVWTQFRLELTAYMQSTRPALELHGRKSRAGAKNDLCGSPTGVLSYACNKIVMQTRSSKSGAVACMLKRPDPATSSLHRVCDKQSLRCRACIILVSGEGLGRQRTCSNLRP